MSITCVTTTLAPCVPAGNTTRLFVPVPYCRLMMYCSLHLYIRVNSLKTAPPETEAEWKAGLICRLWKEELCRGTFTVLRVNQETAYPYFLQGSSVQRRGRCARIKRAKASTLCKDQACKGLDIVQGSSVQRLGHCARIKRAKASTLCKDQACKSVDVVQGSSVQRRGHCARIKRAKAWTLCKDQACSVVPVQGSTVQLRTPAQSTVLWRTLCAVVDHAMGYTLCKHRQRNGVLVVQASEVQWRTRSSKVSCAVTHTGLIQRAGWKCIWNSPFELCCIQRRLCRRNVHVERAVGQFSFGERLHRKSSKLRTRTIPQCCIEQGSAAHYWETDKRHIFGRVEKAAFPTETKLALKRRYLNKFSCMD